MIQILKKKINIYFIFFRFLILWLINYMLYLFYNICSFVSSLRKNFCKPVFELKMLGIDFRIYIRKIELFISFSFNKLQFILLKCEFLLILLILSFYIVGLFEHDLINIQDIMKIIGK